MFLQRRRCSVDIRILCWLHRPVGRFDPVIDSSLLGFDWSFSSGRGGFQPTPLIMLKADGGTRFYYFRPVSLICCCHDSEDGKYDKCISIKCVLNILIGLTDRLTVDVAARFLPSIQPTLFSYSDILMGRNDLNSAWDCQGQKFKLKYLVCFQWAFWEVKTRLLAQSGWIPTRIKVIFPPVVGQSAAPRRSQRSHC